MSSEFLWKEQLAPSSDIRGLLDGNCGATNPDTRTLINPRLGAPGPSLTCTIKSAGASDLALRQPLFRPRIVTNPTSHPRGGRGAPSTPLAMASAMWTQPCTMPAT